MIAARFIHPVPALPRTISDVAPGLDQLLSRVMARFRDDRFATAEEFSVALRAAVKPS
jgi:serine/threonine-protein kinase